ncbi:MULTISPECIES: hypothetical protein [Methylobacterium]|uniref:hypothetical protein n=1 Tax=Methylobacterium TaxID=407 RepID=UPI0013EC4452|nr:hypothetical protein [Methylobacterium sp. DB0501]NGM36166.1 hypothetical protein [Methylobacterium sp. DB0501]
MGGDKWVAGPSEPAPIEGLEIRLNAPGATLRLEYQVLVGGKDGGWTPWLRGEYAGTRGQYRPLLGIRFRLAGNAAQFLTLHVDALFLGSTVETARGNTLELISGAGVDPLVGLKIALVPTTKGKVQSENTAIRPPTAQPAETRASRVRVFRSSSLR